jgi:hypothetical protein
LYLNCTCSEKIARGFSPQIRLKTLNWKWARIGLRC